MRTDLRGGHRHHNLKSPLARQRREGCPMAAFDRLPPAVRHWLHDAALPSSPASARRIWTRAMRAANGNETAAVAALERAEAARLRAEAERR